MLSNMLATSERPVSLAAQAGCYSSMQIFMRSISWHRMGGRRGVVTRCQQGHFDLACVAVARVIGVLATTLPH